MYIVPATVIYAPQPQLPGLNIFTGIPTRRSLSLHMGWLQEIVQHSRANIEVGTTAWLNGSGQRSLLMSAWSLTQVLLPCTVIYARWPEQCWYIQCTPNQDITITFSFIHKSVFEIIGKSHYQGEKRTQCLRCAMLWQNVTWFSKYFWISKNI